MFKLSGDDYSTTVSVSPEPEVEAITGSSIPYVHPGQFVSVVYDKDWCRALNV